MKCERFMGFVNDRQTYAPQMRLVRQLAIFFPTVQSRQWVELAFDGPVSTNDGVGSVEQPDSHDALQHV
jgi:hypothetical protein